MLTNNKGLAKVSKTPGTFQNSAHTYTWSQKLCSRECAAAGRPRCFLCDTRACWCRQDAVHQPLSDKQQLVPGGPAGLWVRQALQNAARGVERLHATVLSAARHAGQRAFASGRQRACAGAGPGGRQLAGHCAGAPPLLRAPALQAPPPSHTAGCRAQVPFSLVFTKVDKRKKGVPPPSDNMAAFQVCGWQRA